MNKCIWCDEPLEGCICYKWIIENKEDKEDKEDKDD